MQRLLILLLTLYIVFIGGTAITTNNPVFTIVFHVVVGVTLGGWLVVKFRKGHPWPRTALDLPLLLYAGLLMLATAFAVDIRVSAGQAWLMLVHVIAFYALVDVMRQGKQRWVFEAMFLTAGAVVAISAFEVASWYFGLGFAGYEYGWFGQDSLLPPNTYKVALALNISTILGNYAMTIIPVIIGWGLGTPQRDYKVGLFALAAGMLLVLIGTQSRGAQGALLTAAGVLAVFQLMRWPRTAALFQPRRGFTLIGLGILASITVLMGFATISSSTSDMRREDMWNSVLQVAQDDPLTGAGVGLFGIEYRFLRDTSFIQDKIVSAHNLPLNTLSELGIGGVVLLAWVAFVFLQAWHRGWRAAPLAQQYRYEGILAALAGFTVHSSIDMFSTTAAVSTVLIIAAYVIAQDRPEPVETSATQLSAPYRWVRVGVLGFVVVSTGWLLTTDVALLRMLGAWRELADDNYVVTLQRFEDAEAIDPTYGVYELQQVYVLGLLADESPGEYLERAIAAHETILEDHPTFDVGHANLAALYLQLGRPDDVAAALDMAQVALRIHPDRWQHHFLLGRIYEQQRMSDEAIDAYQAALELEPEIAGSPYWSQGERDIRREALVRTIAQLNEAPHVAMQVAVEAGLVDVAAELAAELEQSSPRGEEGWFALGRFYADTGALSDAEAALTEAIAQLPAVTDGQVADLARAYALRADVYFRLDSFDAAESDAQAALFLNRVEAADAFYTLARLRLIDGDADAETINSYLVLAVPPRIVFQEYVGTLYYTIAQLDYLPQLELPGPGDDAFTPWLLLAERYATDNDPDTNPQDVYNAIRERAPYTLLDLPQN